MSRPSLRATSKAGRGLLVVAAVLTLAAAVAFSSGLRTRPERRVQVRTRPADVVVAQDAVGCPVTTDCRLTTGIPDTMIEAVRRQFPHAVVQWHSATSNRADGPQRLIALFGLGPSSDTLFVNAECQPGSSNLADRRESSSAEQRSDLAGNQISLLSIREIVVSGAPGCTTDLIINAVGDGARYESGLRSLSADPAVQVRL